MSASASHSGTDSDAPKATAVKPAMESEVEKTHVPYQQSHAELLKNWGASSMIKLNAEEFAREYKHPGPPEWECIICKEIINRTPVYQCQTGHLACYSCSQRGINCSSCSRAVSRSCKDDQLFGGDLQICQVGLQ